MRKGSLALLVLFTTGALAAPVELKVSLRVDDSPLRFGQTYQTPQGLRYQRSAQVLHLESRMWR